MHALIEVKAYDDVYRSKIFPKVYAGIHDVVERKSSPTKKKYFNWSLGIGKQYAELKRTEKEIPFRLKS